MTDVWRQAISQLSPPSLTLVFLGFYEVWKVCSPKVPDFYMSAMCAMSAKCGSLFLLAISMNASAFRAVADDLRGAVETRLLGSRRRAAMLRSHTERGNELG